MSKLNKNYLSGQVYFKSVAIYFIILFVFSLIFIGHKPLKLVAFSSILLTMAYLIICKIGEMRNSELNQILEIINLLRKDEIRSKVQIKLGYDLKELEEEIKEMYLRTQKDIVHLKKLEKMRTQFLANVSHELRTPIFAIQGYLETLADGAIDDQRVSRSFLEKAISRTHNLSELLNDLIDISMIESGEMKLNLSKFDIKNLVDNVIREFKITANEKEIYLSVSCLHKELYVLGDQKRLRQVITNLIQNALKYTEKGSITINLVEHTEEIFISIVDTGIGIAEKDQERIFERFYRVDKDRSRAIGGTGLGLAIVKHILEAHNSKINVKSDLNSGSEFFFKLNKKNVFFCILGLNLVNFMSIMKVVNYIIVK